MSTPRRDLTRIHPDLARVARTVPELNDSSRSLKFLRQLLRWLGRPRRHPRVAIERLSLQTPAGAQPIRLRIYQPKALSKPVPVLLWFHGGGFIVGTPELSDPWALPVVDELGIAVVSVDYRLAPEAPFPAALDDAYGAFRWVREAAASRGWATDRIAVGGESAGGGLAAALTQRVHDQGDPPLVFQLLVYPMLDDRTCVSHGAPGPDPLVWNRGSNRFAWECYLGRTPGGEEVRAYAAPGRLADLSGLPPAWIGVGTEDLFYEEDTAYAHRLRDAGVSCELVSVPGGFHGFDATVPEAAVSRAFRGAQVRALRQALFETTKGT